MLPLLCRLTERAILARGSFQPQNTTHADNLYTQSAFQDQISRDPLFTFADLHPTPDTGYSIFPFNDEEVRMTLFCPLLILYCNCNVATLTMFDVPPLHKSSPDQITPLKTVDFT